MKTRYGKLANCSGNHKALSPYLVEGEIAQVPIVL
jgi:hypothetical protein